MPDHRDGGAEPVVVLDRHPHRPRRLNTGLMQGQPTTRPAADPRSRRSASSVFGGHWFSHCDRNDSTGSGSSGSSIWSRPTAASSCRRIIRSRCGVQCGDASRHASTSSSSASRGADHSISSSPSPSSSCAKRELPAGSASTGSPSGAPSTPATAAAAPAPPSSAPPLLDRLRLHLPRLIHRRHDNREPVHRLLRAQASTGTRPPDARSPPARSPPAPCTVRLAPSPTPAPAAAPP